MANNVTLDPGVIPSIPVATDEASDGQHYQKIKLVDSTADSITPIGTSANPLPISSGAEYDDNQSGITTPRGEGLIWFDDAGNAYAVKDTNPLPVYFPTSTNNYVAIFGDANTADSPAHVTAVSPFPELGSANNKDIMQVDITWSDGLPTVFEYKDASDNVLATKTITYTDGNPTNITWEY